VAPWVERNGPSGDPNVVPARHGIDDRAIERPNALSGNGRAERKG
jgi:hypothetical protein